MAKQNPKRDKTYVRTSLPEDYLIVPSFQTLPSVFRFNPIILPIKIYAIIDPYFAFVTQTSLMSLCGLKEIELFTSADNNIFRQTLILQPGFATNIVRPNIEEQVIINNQTKKLVQDNSRERSQFQVAISPYIWIISFLIAYAPAEIRSEFISRATQSGKVPTIFTEQLKRVRISRSGRFEITPVIMQSVSNLFITIYPEYARTFLDVNYLYTSGGLQALCELFMFMSMAPGNYIPMSDATAANMPSLQAGFTTRFNAIGFTVHNFKNNYPVNVTTSYTPPSSPNFEYSDWLNADLYLTPGNAYGKTVESSHIADAHIVFQVHSTTNGFMSFISDKYYNSFCTTSETLTSVATTTALATHIVYRVCGIITNAYIPREKDSDLLTDKTKRTDSSNTVPESQTQTKREFSSLIAGIIETILGNDVNNIIKVIKLISKVSNNRALMRKFYALSA